MESLLGLTLGENAKVTGLDWRTGWGLGEGGIKRGGRGRHSAELSPLRRREKNNAYKAKN